jgi:Fe-S-cluster containining protein
MSKGRKAPPPTDRSTPMSAVTQRMQPAASQTNECIAVAEQAERQAVITLFAEKRTPAQTLQVAQHAAWLATNLVEQLVDTQGIACRAGCAWCCSLFVSATAPEILQIADYLRATYSADDLAALHERLVQREQQFATLTAEQRSAARLPCVLLVNGRCSVYPVRPLACGSWTSTDARRCEESWRQHWATTITANQMQLWLYGGVMLGLREGLEAYRLASEQLDLTTALRIALDTPDAADRWLAGEPIFAPARIALDAVPAAR